ncbi:MAG: hypothetical protein CBC24_03395 [Candidatus Pelagibacter sp. TMED64]|nr:hypothetical protein [Candidatus Pelagibacter sp.]OUU66387.1 MAG: hypothetical protein CBC24_03395 [Candidatus Pelagibacter sp. TMED64]|tara:strand:+ start:13004 stop:13711 length:708 start_codon:yes stop_codon:yes gene_type:complete
MFNKIFSSIKYRFKKFFLKIFLRFDSIYSINRVKKSKNTKGLFIDCGSNIGQGFNMFKKFFPLKYFDYVLIEPNPNCLNYLKEIKKELEQKEENKIDIINKAASSKDGTTKFFGLSEDKRGILSDGGSILKEHNSLSYDAIENKAIEVETFSLSDFIKRKSLLYDTIILKLDIEGAEYEVLENLLFNKMHLKLNIIYNEFHSEYMDYDNKKKYNNLEKKLVHNINKDKIKLRIWF